MSIHRRSFLRGLAGAFGAASIPDLHARILDHGAPILLKPTVANNRIFVAPNGALALGDLWDWRDAPRPTWHQYFIDCGAKTFREVQQKATEWEIGDLERLIGDEYWPSIFDMHYEPPAAAYHFLRQQKIGPKTLVKRPCNGRIDFFAGSNHPGSDDLWCEVWDDLSASLLQARLIELGYPIEIVMENRGSIVKDDHEIYGFEPANE
jgi:hypothetical protein